MKKPVSLASWLLAAQILAAFSTVDTPKVGVTRHRDGTVNALYGMHANFVYGEQMFRLTQAVSFSDQAGLVASRGQIALVSSAGSTLAVLNADEANPLLNVDGSVSSAVAWLPSHRTLVFTTGSALSSSQVDQDLGGLVHSLWRDGNTAHLLTTATTSGTVSRIDVDLPTGAILSTAPIPGATGSAFYQQGFILYRGNSGIEVLSPDNSIRTLALPEADLTFERLSTGWLHLHSDSSGKDYALHLDATAFELSELPVPPANSPAPRRAPARGSEPVQRNRGLIQ